MTAWWAASFDPSCLHHPVWPFRTFFGDCRERPAIGGYFSSVFLNCPVSALQSSDFGPPSLVRKFPFLGGMSWERTESLAVIFGFCRAVGLG